MVGITFGVSYYIWCCYSRVLFQVLYYANGLVFKSAQWKIEVTAARTWSDALGHAFFSSILRHLGNSR